MNIMKICLVVVLIFWLITEFAPEEISAITGMIGIGVAVVAVILFNNHHNKKQAEQDAEDNMDDVIEDDAEE